MTPDELRSLMEYLRQRVRLVDPDSRELEFQEPSEDRLVKAGFDAAAVRRLLTAPWWPEMVEEIIETGELCEPDETAEQVLDYARDVVVEYLRKRFEP